MDYGVLIPGVYIKGNDRAGMLNGKIKALLEASMMNRSALLLLYHDKVKRASPGHLPGDSSQARALRGPGGEGRPGVRAHTCRLVSSPGDPRRPHPLRHRLHQESSLRPGDPDLYEAADTQGAEM